MDSVVEHIKAHYQIAPMVAPHTNGLKPSGNGFFMGDCPFCTKSKTFWVADHLGLCGCFNPGCDAFCDKRQGSSRPPMDVINFYAKANDLSNEDAIKALAQGLPTVVGFQVR